MTTDAGTPQYIRGVPHPLPPGERLLWQGAPDARALAVHVFHRRMLFAYFAAMLVLWAVPTSMRVGRDELLVQGAMLLAIVAFVLGLVELLARLVARTSWYAITDRRLVLRIGMVLPMSINIPFTILESAGVGRFADGTGQVLLRLVHGQRIAYIALWPHCRPFRINQPEPVLRGLTEPGVVGDILSKAVAAASAASAAPVVMGGRSSGEGAHGGSLPVPEPAQA